MCPYLWTEVLVLLTEHLIVGIDWENYARALDFAFATFTYSYCCNSTFAKHSEKLKISFYSKC